MRECQVRPRDTFRPLSPALLFQLKPSVPLVAAWVSRMAL